MSRDASLVEASGFGRIARQMCFPVLFSILFRKLLVFSMVSCMRSRVFSSGRFFPVRVSAASCSPARFAMPMLLSSLKYWSPFIFWVRNGSRFLPCCERLWCLMVSARCAISSFSLRFSWNFSLSFSLS